MTQFGIALCCLFLLVMTYTWQHFKAIEYGYKIEFLKNQRNGLAELNRNYRLEEASLRSPDRIDRLARQYGMQPPQAGQDYPHGDSALPESGQPVMASAAVISVSVRLWSDVRLNLKKIGMDLRVNTNLGDKRNPEDFWPASAEKASGPPCLSERRIHGSQSHPATAPLFGSICWLRVLVLWCSLICLRLGYLQILRYGSFEQKAVHQQLRTEEVSARRGIIYDRAGRELAMSISVDSVFAVPADVPDLAGTISLISKHHGSDPHEILARCKSCSHVLLDCERKADAEIADRIRALNLRGIYFQKESQTLLSQARARRSGYWICWHRRRRPQRD
jgi:cell division protein FtsL